MCPLINEGWKILDEGIAYRASDTDVVWGVGYGFPSFRCGSMWIADAIELELIAGRMACCAYSTGDTFDYWKLAGRLAAANANRTGRVSQTS